MRLPDQRKRQHILSTAARLFARRPFHEVRLDDVAAAAQVGKGTLYVYFNSKEDLYFSLVHEGFTELVHDLDKELSDSKASAWERLTRVVHGLVGFAFAHPQLFDLMRALPAQNDGRRGQRYGRMVELVERTIRLGIESGEMSDDDPHLTALFIPGLVRSAMIHGGRGITGEALARHILHLLRQGIGRKGKR